MFELISPGSANADDGWGGN